MQLDFPQPIHCSDTFSLRKPALLKKVPTADLKPGMFVVDLNSGWLGHPFIRNKLRLDAESVAAIREAGIVEVTIDTERGLDADAPSLESVRRQEESELAELGRPPLAEAIEQVSPHHRVRANLVVGKAVNAVRGMMNDIRLGSPPDIALLEDIAREVALEVFANPAMLVAIHHLHRTCEYTFGHSVRVAILAVSCARRMGLASDYCEQLALGGLLHDVGKMKVHREILEKPGKLTADEMEHMRDHVNLGAALLRQANISDDAKLFLQEHHERFDGNGYPLRLRGMAISLAGRIGAIADVYDAISSNRWYQQALPPAAAIRKIHEWSKHHFDQEITTQFIRSVGIYPAGSLVRLNNKRLAVVVEHQQRSALHPKVRAVFDLHAKRPLANSTVLDLFERRHITIEGHEDPAEWGIDPTEHL